MTSPDDSPEPDLPPEYCHYKDEGCQLAASCLNCPFKHCVYEEPGGALQWLKKLRNREMAALFHEQGKKVKELSRMFGVSERTVQRALKDTVKALPPAISLKKTEGES
ncbi:MAG: helix-turn-helix domain-containing protein [Chloroflexi bacterium]|nr:helix-turn-helix domain-containing protein [Chloroflexota bacterium]